ncbi:hypothetical protein FRC07_011491, partial [Ceratobasidium sp. 392]
MQRAQMKNRDKRMRLMSELLNNIETIKFYAWEDSFIARVLKIRNGEELRMLRKIGITNAVSTTIWTGAPLLVALGAFATAAYMGSKSLTADIVFPGILLFNLLQIPLGEVVNVIGQVVESTASVSRIRVFLLSEKLQSDAREVYESAVSEGEPVVEIRGGVFKWSKTATQPTLEGVDLTIRKGELVCILGPVGCGKTSLLSAILGEMIREEGSAKVRGKIAYVPQNPWMMNATIRDNILFSHRYDEEFYNIVLNACALQPDFAQFPEGDMTEVGEGGITLSGSQLARISLARAVYARADLYLLDNLLAAVDAQVSRHLFDRVIGPNGLLAGKTRLHVMDGVSCLSQYDFIVLIRRGIILESGTYDDSARNPGSELSKLIASSKTYTSRAHSGTDTPADDTAAASEATLAPAHVPAASKPVNGNALSFFQRRPSVVLPQRRVKTKAEQKAEHREQGKVKAEVYQRYFRAASLAGVILSVICMIVQQGGSIFSNITLREWANQNQVAKGNSNVPYYLFVYGMLALGAWLFSFVGLVLLWAYCAIKSARILHDTMLSAVMRSPLSFFEQTPMGQIINLFSQDQYVIDEAL